MTATCQDQGRRALAKPTDLSEYLGKPIQTLAIWRMKGIGPKFLKLENGSVRYRWEEIDAWLEAQAGGQAA
ncbi:hypothetical protein A5N78_20585 [Prescottella equi]|uniref:helix-turn-helix transcriptional regulator n=1 Tax=Rhodococcus hoagii TaxID=43767 RepID=UPI000A117F0C|nr:hypothetical protein [Prescottella equi]ORL86105.1 hypothetical protein A5N78_20585 [Prescottella equi]ORM13209.1 hypothetical protein A5N70_20975 [Prescottella equi]